MDFACIARSTSSIRCAAARKSASVYPFVVIAAVPDAHAGGLLGASRFVGNTVFVERDAMAVELILHRLAGEPRFREIEQEQVVVRAAGHNVVAHFPELLAHRAAVSHNGVDVFAVFVRAGFLGGDGLARDHMLERPALRAGNTALSTFFASSGLQKIMPPRGPRSVLCVVVVMMSASPNGDG